MKPPLYILFHGRFPSEKAAALFVAENARSLAEHFSVTILAPRRLDRKGDAYEEYELPSSVRVEYLPTIDLFAVPVLSHIAFGISLMVFTISCAFYLAVKGRKAWIISTDLLPGLMAVSLGSKLMFEVHDYPEHHKGLHKSLFQKAHIVIATNKWKQEALQKEFPEARDVFVMERNGVEVVAFGKKSTDEARKSLSLPNNVKLVVYTGHLYAWKGVTTLLEAAKQLPAYHFYFVGGTPDAVEAHRNQYKDRENIHFIGHIAHEQIPDWQSAADILVLPNTAREEISARYTSPMKLFEYMASERLIAASSLPSITEIVDETTAYLFEPDNADSLKAVIQQGLSEPEEAAAKAQKARNAALEFSWTSRAERLMKRMRERE
jgi:glycosyltransferase involved in cell wall biosynthesis